MSWLPCAGSPPEGLLLPGMDEEPDCELSGDGGVDPDGDWDDGLDEPGCEDGLDGCDDGLCGVGGELDGVEGEEGEGGDGIGGLDDEDELVLSQAASTPVRHSTASPCHARPALSCLAMLRMSTFTLSSGVGRADSVAFWLESPYPLFRFPLAFLSLSLSLFLCILRPYCHGVNYH